MVPSIALSVTSRYGAVWEAAIGAADREGAVKATPLTSYPVASVAKSLTAVGALRAMDRGLLDLDRPVGAYLGDSAIRVPIGDAKRLTTRALLHMTAGIPHVTAGIPHVVRFHWADAPSARVLDEPIGHFAVFPPGRQFHSSNASLGIVGDILARIARWPFAQFVDRPVAEDSAWRGTWTGFVEVRGQRVPARIVIDSSGYVGAVGADATLPAHPVRATASNGVLETRIAGVLPGDAVGGQSHTLQIELRRDGPLLTGYVTASARIGGRPLFMLPYFVSLRRDS